MPHSSPESTQLILQTLLTIVSQVEGSLELLKVEDLSSLTEIAPQYPLVLDILNYTWANGSTIEVQAVHESINRVIPNLLVVFKGTDAVTFLSFISSFIPKLTSEVNQYLPYSVPSLTYFRRFHVIQSGLSL